MSAYKSDFLQRSGRARLHPSGLRAGGARRAARARADHRLYRLRLHGGLAARRLAAADHDAALAAEDRPPADRADGRRHHARRRSLRQGREPPHPDRRGDRGQLKGIRAIFAKFLNFGGAAATPSWSTTPSGSTRSTTSISCATSAGISRSTGCWRSTRSSCGSSASRSSRSSNSTT